MNIFKNKCIKKKYIIFEIFVECKNNNKDKFIKKIIITDDDMIKAIMTNKNTYCNNNLFFEDQDIIIKMLYDTQLINKNSHIIVDLLSVVIY